jgi:hypothetical protein
VIIEKHVNLAKSAILRFRKAEPAPQVTEKVGAGIKETSFGSPIPGLPKNYALAEAIDLGEALS